MRQWVYKGVMTMSLYYSDEHTTIYKQDNLELLRDMKSESVDLIYCDILYNT